MPDRAHALAAARGASINPPEVRSPWPSQLLVVTGASAVAGEVPATGVGMCLHCHLLYQTTLLELYGVSIMVLLGMVRLVLGSLSMELTSRVAAGSRRAFCLPHGCRRRRWYGGGGEHTAHRAQLKHRILNTVTPLNPCANRRAESMRHRQSALPFKCIHVHAHVTSWSMIHDHVWHVACNVAAI